MSKRHILLSLVGLTALLLAGCQTWNKCWPRSSTSAAPPCCPSPCEAPLVAPGPVQAYSAPGTPGCCQPR